MMGVKNFISLFLLLILSGTEALVHARQNQAQGQLDSLLLRLNHEENDTIRVDLLNQITRIYAGIDLIKAKEYAIAAVSQAEQADWPIGIATSEQYLGNVLMESGQRQEALSHFGKAYDLFVELGDAEGEISMLYNLGNIHQHENRYTEAFDFFMKGMDLAEKNNHPSLQAKGAYLVSAIFVQQHNFEKARVYAGNAASIFRKEKNYTELANSLEIIGVSHLLEKDAEQAKKPFLEAIQYLDTIGNDFGKAKIYTQLVECYNNEPAVQLAYIEKSQEIWERSNLTTIYTISNIGNRGTIYINLYQNDSLRNKMPPRFTMSKAELLKAADSDLKQGISLAKESGNREQLMQFYRAYYRVLEEQGRYKEAIEILNSSHQISDSLFSQENKNRIAAMESQREIDLRDKQLAINELQLSNARRTRLALIGGAALLFVIGGLLLYQNVQRRRTNAALLALNNKLDEANKVKTRFFGILSHDLRGPVANLIHFLHLQKNAPDLLDDSSTELYQQKLTDSAENVLETMETVLLWSKSQMERFTPQKKMVQVSSLFEYLRNNIPTDPAIVVSYSNPEAVSVHTDEDYLKTILYNLTVNALKALKNTPDPQLEWKAVRQDNKVQLSITDNGPGILREQADALYNKEAAIGTKSGLGLHIIRDLADAIQCCIVLDTGQNKGTLITLSFS